MMTEEQFKIVNLQETLAISDNETCKYYQNNNDDFKELCKRLNNQEQRITELEGITERLNRFNDKLIHENNTFKDKQRAYCNNCELAKTQHEQIQDLKQQLKEPTSLLYSFIEHFNKQDYRCDCMDQQISIEENDVIDFLQEKGLE